MQQVGPVSEETVSHGQCVNILSELKEKRSKANNMEYFLNKVPVMNRSRFLSTLQFLNFILNQEETKILEDVSGKEIVAAADISGEITNEDALFENHNTEEVEKQLIAMISAGKEEVRLQSRSLIMWSGIFMIRFVWKISRTVLDSAFLI